MKKSSILYLCLLPGTAFLSLSVRSTERLVPSQYPTLQAAVDVAQSGDTIRIAAGEHPFQAVVRNKTLSIVGDTGAALVAHPNMSFVPWNQNVAVLAFERASVIVSNLVLEGNQLANDYSGLFMGVIFRSASGQMVNCKIRGFRGVSEKQTRAVNVNNVLNAPTHVILEGCTFSDNHISASFFGRDDDPSRHATTFLVRSNVFSGIGAEAPFSDVGVWVSFGAGGNVIGNTFTNYIFNAFENNAAAIVAHDGGFFARGFFAALPPTGYYANRFSNNSIHMAGHVINGSKITNNVFGPLAEGALEAGLSVSGANILIADNNFDEMSVGIRLFGQGDKLLGVSRGLARNVKVTGNWFTNVIDSIRTNELVTFQETGTQLCCFAPEFREIRRTGDEVQFKVRSWHEQSFNIGLTSDFKQWSDSGTTTTFLPNTEFEVPVEADRAFQFFRLLPLFTGPILGEDDAGSVDP